MSESPLVEALFGLLISVEEISGVTGESAVALVATKDEIEGTIGSALNVSSFVDRGRGAIERLTSPFRDEPPGTFETLMEVGDFLLGGDGAGEDKE